MRYRVTLDGLISSASHDLDDEVRHALDAAMTELFKLDANSPSIDLDFTGEHGTVTISCAVDVPDADEAVPPASGVIRSALHHAGFGTSGWPKKDDPRWVIEIIGTRAVKLVAA